MPKLTVQIPGEEPLTYEFDDPQVNVGRGDENHITIQHPSLSGQHAVFFRDENGDYALSDSNSTNGTFVDNQAIDTVELSRTEPSHIIFGQVSTLFTPDQETAGEEASAAEPSAPEPAGAPAGRQEVSEFRLPSFEPMGRPTNFTTVSPYPRHSKKSSLPGTLAMLLGFVSLFSAAALAGAVLFLLRA